MNQQFETLIIGAGPAGMACGITLRQKGLEVCVIDKAQFPRSKTCAGLVTEKTYELLQKLYQGTEIRHLFCHQTSEVQLFQRTRSLVKAGITTPVRFVNRKTFDHALTEHYRSLGGLLLEGIRIEQIDEKGRTLVLADGSRLSYNNLIFADGALSMSRKFLHLGTSHLAFGIEAHIPADQYSMDSVGLYFDIIKGGYIWIFPHGDTLCIGAVNHYARQENYRQILSDFLSEIGLDPSKISFTGAFLPYGQVIRQEQLPEHMLLIGDAGGFADPISGEGLFLALKSGMLAAESIASRRGKSAFLTGMQPFVRIIKDGLRLQKFFYRPAVQKWFLRKVPGKQRFITFYFDHQVSGYQYRYTSLLRMYRDYKRNA